MIPKTKNQIYFLKKLMITCSLKMTGNTQEEDGIGSRKQGV